MASRQTELLSTGHSMNRSVSHPVARRSALFLLAAVIVLWGANWPVMKLGVARTGPMTFALARMVMAALCMVALTGVLGRVHLPTRRDWPIVLSVGVLQMGVFMGLATVALQYAEANRSALLASHPPPCARPAAL